MSHIAPAPAPTPWLPSRRDLAERLSEALGEGPVEIVHRRPLGAGTFPKEEVRCRTSGGEHHLFCKYEAPRDDAFGHRGGIAHEARVYREILESTALPAPRLVAGGEIESGGAWVALGFLDGAVRLSEAWERMADAATWLGRFHRSTVPLVPRAATFAVRYDAAYYRRWAERTQRFAHHHGVNGPWMAPLVDTYEQLVDVLTGAEPTVIHGEFTVHNVMVSGDDVIPTDWETAAVAPGEIDLMCLVDRWDVQTVTTCVDRYLGERWAGSAPADLERRLRAAELYLHFRWLGESAELMLGKKRRWRLERLAAIAHEMGLDA